MTERGVCECFRDCCEGGVCLEREESGGCEGVINDSDPDSDQ